MYKKSAARLEEKSNELMKDIVALKVATSGKPRGANMIDYRNIYNDLFNTNTYDITHIVTAKSDLDTNLLHDRLIENGWELAVTKNQYALDENIDKPVEVVYTHQDYKMLMNIEIDYRSEEDNSDEEDKEFIPLTDDIFATAIGKIAYTKVAFIMHPYRQMDSTIADKIKELADLMNAVKRKSEKGASIGIISMSNNNYYVKEFSLENKTPKFLFPDLHYGEGFEDFNNKLLERLKVTTKGLILFHGDPGTGKTQYIRVLLKELAKINKSILYAPPSLSASLTNPEMIEFISDWVLDEDRDCILLIEDAEPLLEVRAGADGRSTGISNLLNMTDGILNDILGLTVIATFNTPITKIDPALLRPQRLTARKEFRKLPREQFVKLAEAIGVELPDIQYPATLAEFYSAKLKNQVLLHEVHQESGIGFRR